MQRVENDMDDLFQRAAENYPLLIGEGDWESIAKQIAPKSDPPDALLPKSNNRHKKFIVFGILLLILLPGWLMYQQKFSDKLSIAKSNELAKKSGNRSANTINDNNSIVISSGGARDSRPGNNKLNAYRKTTSTSFTTASTKTITGINRGISYPNSDPAFGAEKKTAISQFTGEPKNNNYLVPTLYFLKETAEAYPENFINNSEAILEQGRKIDKKFNLIFKERITAVINGSTKKEKQLNIIKKRNVYVGLVAGVDFSKVRSMPFNSEGLVGGLLIGYNIKKNFSIEAGITWSDKNYSSQGSSFNMDKVRLSMPAGMIINTIESKSSVIEIPLKVKYDVIVKKKSAIFISAGISSYIMTKEKNNYLVSMNGNQEKITGNYDRDNYGLPAIANISIGYEHSVSQYLKLRIEPSFKIPVRGIGIGNLPVTSAGLQIGITRQLK